jgi:hypothetical protein
MYDTCRPDDFYFELGAYFPGTTNIPYAGEGPARHSGIWRKTPSQLSQ